MNMRVPFAVIAIFLTWMALDMLIHGYLLADIYAATKEFWRPQEEMKLGLSFGGMLLSAVLLVSLYTLFVDRKTMETALGFGLILGIGIGFSMGFGTYAFMPIPLGMAAMWFAGEVVKWTAAGAILGLFHRKRKAPVPHGVPEA